MEKVYAISIPETVTTAGGLIIAFPKTIHGCKCRNIQQRREAVRQAHAIVLDQTSQIQGKGVLLHRPNQSPAYRVTLEEYLGESGLCPVCVQNAYVLEAIAQSESFVESALEALNPLPA